MRLPLNTIASLISRPMKDQLWFPTEKSDYVLLPDESFGQIALQTPDMIEVIVRGGMLKTYPTAEFYGLSIINLSRNETFGVTVAFGFDYQQQAISLTEIPASVSSAISVAFKSRGYTAQT